MYIRRKVFSIGYDANGEERLFSTNEILNEDAYLRMFAEKEEEKEEKKGLTKAQKRALIAGAGVAATAAGIYGANKLGHHMLKKNAESKVGKYLAAPGDKIAKVSKKAYKGVRGKFGKKAPKISHEDAVKAAEESAIKLIN